MDDHQIDATKQNSDSLGEDGVNTADEVEFVEDREWDAPDLSARFEKAKSALKRCEQEKKEYLEGWQRAKADYINYRNNEWKRLEDIGRFVVSSMASDFLPVIDSFDLALTHGVSPEIEKGVLLIKSQFYDILKKRGLEEIKTNPGETFDPEKHESVGETESDQPPGSIAQILQKGYLLQGKVLRPARVKLAKEK